MDRPAGAIARVDPRVKLVVALVLCVCVVTLPSRAYMAWAAYLAIVVVSVLANHRVAADIGRRAVRPLPFLVALVVLVPLFRPGRQVWQWGGLTVSAEGLYAAATLFLGSLLCVGAFAVVTATTPEERLLEGLRGIGVPATVAGVIAFMLRYLHVLRPELHRLRDARDARTIGPGGPGVVRSGANVLGALLLRSFDRAERVADAMAARGYDGQLLVHHRHPARTGHVVAGALVTAIIVLIRVAGWTS